MTQAERVLLTVDDLERKTVFGIEDAQGILDAFLVPSWTQELVRMGVRQEGAAGSVQGRGRRVADAPPNRQRNRWSTRGG